MTVDKDLNANWFSRAVIPYIRGIERNKWEKAHQFYKHVGMYAYTPKALEEFSKMEQTTYEKAESLEQLRWLENGNRIRVGITKHQTFAVDTIEDLELTKIQIEKHLLVYWTQQHEKVMVVLNIIYGNYIKIVYRLSITPRSIPSVKVFLMNVQTV